MSRRLPAALLSRWSRSCYRYQSQLSVQGSRNEDDTAVLTNEQKDSLRKFLPQLRTDESSTSIKSESYKDGHASPNEQMDAIRARGLLKFTYNFEPPANVADIVGEELSARGLEVTKEWDLLEFEGLEQKTAVLTQLGSRLRHFVPNSRLHEIKTAANLLEFYRQPVKNITKYVEMARNDSKPMNIAALEQPVRFHPNDVETPHGGVTAFPGEGGKVFSLRQKRLLRQFKPKKEWYEFEDQTFDYNTADEGMPWDPAIAKKMDRYTHKKFFTNNAKKIPQP